MNGHMVEGKLRQDIRDSVPLFRLLITDAGFDRQIHGQLPGENLIQEGDQITGIPEQTAAPAAFRHGRGGAAEIQIRPVISKLRHIVQPVQQLQGMLRQGLGQHPHSPVFRRIDIPLLPGQKGHGLGQLMERQAVNVHAAKELLMHPPQNSVRDPFHRSEIDLHHQLSPAI